MNKEEKAGRKAGRQTRTERETETHRLRDREYQRDTENRGGRQIKGERVAKSKEWQNKNRPQERDERAIDRGGGEAHKGGERGRQGKTLCKLPHPLPESRLEQSRIELDNFTWKGPTTVI